MMSRKTFFHVLLMIAGNNVTGKKRHQIFHNPGGEVLIVQTSPLHLKLGIK